VDDGGDANVWLRLPGNGVDAVTTKIIEDAVGWAGYGLIEVAVGGDGYALIVVEDGEGFEALLQVNVVLGDDVVGFDA